MGNPKQNWTAEEEEALRARVAKHGTGKWKNIQKDPEFNHFLYSRSDVDLKMFNSSALPSLSSSIAIVAGNDATSFLPAVVAPPRLHTQSMLYKGVDDNKTPLDDKSSKRQNEMIFEALEVLKSPKGSDASAVFNYIEVPHTFRRLLSSRSRRMVQQEKLDKIQNCYKLKSVALSGARGASTEQKDNRAANKLPSRSDASTDTVEGAAATASYWLAETGNKSCLAAEAVKE